MPKVNYIIGNAQHVFTTTFPDGHSTWTVGTQLLVDLLRFSNILIHQTISVRKPNHRAANSINGVVCYCKHLAWFTIQFAILLTVHNLRRSILESICSEPFPANQLNCVESVC